MDKINFVLKKIDKKVINQQIRLFRIHSKIDKTNIPTQTNINKQVKLSDDEFKKQILNKLDEQNNQLSQIDFSLHFINLATQVTTIMLLFKY